MQRSKLIGSNMDKQWEAQRRGDRRAAVRLNNGLQEIEEAQLYHVNSMTKEQKRLQMDLIKMKQSKSKNKTTNPKGVPPGKPALLQTFPGSRGQICRTENRGDRKQPAHQSDGSVMASGSSMTLQMRINDFMDGVNKKGKTDSPSSPSPNTEPSLSGINMTDLKNSMAKRLSISESSPVLQGEGSIDNEQKSSDKSKEPTIKTSLQETTSKPMNFNPQFVKPRRGSLFKEKLFFDEEIYAPDGGLRTLHAMPDMMNSFEEAKKARYIRHKNKLDSEKELSVQEIFQDTKK
ncbi:coiled-coil domain-containing protein 190 isoform 2-T2 [Pelodytes ibericus]